MLIQRVFAFVILAAFIGGPASRLECLLSCGAVQVAERTESCHSTKKSADLALDAGTDHCDKEETLPIAIAATRGDAQAHHDGLIPTDVPMATTAQTAGGAGVPPPDSTPPPLTGFLVPLRI